MSIRNSSGTSSLTIHLLDMGTEMYGDAILCQCGERSILIDGGHAKDIEDRNGYPSIPKQLAGILGYTSPFKLDLLVITHYHGDHIGCLPEMVNQGIIAFDWALVADENLGSGRGIDDRIPDTPSMSDQLLAALREEEHYGLDDTELARFIEDAASIDKRYQMMLSDLASYGTRIVRYGRDDHEALENAFKDFSLKIIGPSQKQLLICSQKISSYSDRVGDYLTLSDSNLVSAYKQILSSTDALPAGAEDMPGKGAAINDQSIVIKIGDPGKQALLTGDMQFAKPEISGLSPYILSLRKAVADFGPYEFIKLPHHASYNGFDSSVLKEWQNTKNYASSGGTNDLNHPDPDVLELLSQNSDKIEYARTDRNGKIAITFADNGAILEKTRGKLNDFSPNSDLATKTPSPPPSFSIPTISLERTQGQFTELSASAKVPPDVSRILVSFDIFREKQTSQKKDTGSGEIVAIGEQEKKHVGIEEAPSVFISRQEANEHLEELLRYKPKFASGRRLPKLLFVSYKRKLSENIGLNETLAIYTFVQDSGQSLYLVNDQANSLQEVRIQLKKSKYDGVVIIGNYDVVPARRLDALPSSLRQYVGQNTADADNFIIWSDEAYGDLNADGSWDIPVSRIPDGKSAKVVIRSLCADRPGNETQTRFGIRNIARPFAEAPFELLPGVTPILVSEPTTPSQIGAGNAKSAHVYFMLHGSDNDATRFWGESATLGTIEAVQVSNVPREISGVVFSGCCWGALPVNVKAVDWSGNERIGGRTPSSSIALAYIEAGALAFIGCTGTHYSPTQEPYNYFGGPMHKAFWNNYLQGKSPVRALFDAKIDYLRGMPHGQNDAMSRAIEYKILRQFCCLGMGW